MAKINNLQQVYMWKIGLICFSLKDSKDNIASFVGNETNSMKDNVITIFNNTKPLDETYIYLLRIIQYSSEQDTNLANYYRKNNLEQKIIPFINNNIVIYKKFNCLSDNDEEEKTKTQEQRQLEFRILSAQIDCLTGLMNSNIDNSKEFFKSKVHENILSILALDRADPLLMIS